MKKINSFKSLIIISVLVIINVQGIAQNVGISSSFFIPDTSAGLEINFADKGLLIPRVAIQSTTMPTPVQCQHKVY